MEQPLNSREPRTIRKTSPRAELWQGRHWYAPWVRLGLAECSRRQLGRSSVRCLKYARPQPGTAPGTCVCWPGWLCLHLLQAQLSKAQEVGTWPAKGRRRRVGPPRGLAPCQSHGQPERDKRAASPLPCPVHMAGHRTRISSAYRRKAKGRTGSEPRIWQASQDAEIHEASAAELRRWNF